MHESLTTIAFGMPGGIEWIVIGVIGLLIFGRRLPEVGRSIGQGIIEFKKGLKGIQDDMDGAGSEEPAKRQLDQGGQRAGLEQGQADQGGEQRGVSQAGGSTTG